MFSKRQLPAEVFGLSDSTRMDSSGAVTSIQSATVKLPPEGVDVLWNAHWLERLARTYWRFLTRATLGLIRVVYSEEGREVVLIARPLRLLTFAKPEYTLTPNHGVVTWRIAGGLLVAKANKGLLRISVTRGETSGDAAATLRVVVEVSNFYPPIAAKISDHLYRWTQSRTPVIATYGFLNSLARGDLAESKAGQFAEATDGQKPQS